MTAQAPPATRRAAGEPPAAPPGETSARRGRVNSPENTRADILVAAAREFAINGFSGARVDAIADQTQTSKRMLYYYFGSKEGIYRCVLLECYRALRRREGELDLANLSPIDALKAIVEFNFNHHIENQDFIRMVMNENVLMGRNLREIPFIKAENSSVIEMLREICEKGAAEGAMRAQVDPVDLHMSISALCVFNVSNRHTFSYLFDRDMMGQPALEARRKAVVDMILSSVAPE